MEPVLRPETDFVSYNRKVRGKRIPSAKRRDGRVAEGARLESVFRGNSNVGSNPTLSAIKINNLQN